LVYPHGFNVGAVTVVLEKPGFKVGALTGFKVGALTGFFDTFNGATVGVFPGLHPHDILIKPGTMRHVDIGMYPSAPTF
jgi:hypothetical protein